MTKRFGFTLAEVLITLGIIGVVAAMTMPTLINQTNGAQYKAAYKKALSAISQAVTLNVALDDIGFAEITKTTAGGTIDKESGKDTIGSVLNSRMNIVNHAATPGYTLPTLNAISTEVACEGTTGGCSDGKKTVSHTLALDTYLFFNDGSMFAYESTTAENCTLDTNQTGHTYCYGIIDVNGAKGPNKEVACDSAAEGAPCTVKSPTDIYPVVFYDQTILPASDAAKAVLYGK